MKDKPLIEYCKQLFPRYQTPEHVVRLANALERVASGECRRLIINMPPRHGKSLLTSTLFPSWWLGLHPDKRVIITAYGAELAERWSRRVKRIVQTKKYKEWFPYVELSKDSRSVQEWDIEHFDGGVKAIGVGGGITGHGASLLIIDDPHKGREAADSKTQRESVMEWYTGEAYQRLEPTPEDAAIVIIQTRWNEDDLTGQLLETAKDPEADQWEQLNLQALSGENEDQPLWPDRFAISTYNKIRANVGERDWEAQYQQRPAPPEGNLIKNKWFTIVDRAPDFLKWIRYWDLATTEEEYGDYTVGLKLSVDSAGNLWVGDVQRIRKDWPDVTKVIKAMTLADGKGVYQAFEAKSFQKAVVQELIAEPDLYGYPLMASKLDGDKYSRALAWANRASVTGVFLVRAPWNEDLLHECRFFPNGANDDIVDAISGAFLTSLSLPYYKIHEKGHKLRSDLDTWEDRHERTWAAMTGKRVRKKKTNYG